MTSDDTKYDFDDDGPDDDGLLIVWKAAHRVDLEDRYDWEAFYLEIIRRAAHQNGQPFDAEALRDDMRHWCLLTWRRCPNEGLLRDKLAPVCRTSDDLGHGSGKGDAPERAAVESPAVQQAAPGRPGTSKKKPQFFFAE